MRSSPALARTMSHISLERTRKSFRKYCEHDDRSSVHVLKHAKMKITAISLSPNVRKMTEP